MFRETDGNAFALLFRVGDTGAWQTAGTHFPDPAADPVTFNTTLGTSLCFGVNDWVGPPYWPTEWYDDNQDSYAVTISEEAFGPQEVPYRHRCGDGCLSEGETCDDKNTDNSDACVEWCTKAFCGDKFVRAVFEVCDDGNKLNGDGCDNNCTPTACGNGIVTAPEACDDANQIAGDGCTGCQRDCGNGRLDPGELCDDGNVRPHDGCSDTCRPDFDCGMVTIPACRDGCLTGDEDCDVPSVEGTPSDACLHTWSPAAVPHPHWRCTDLGNLGCRFQCYPE